MTIKKESEGSTLSVPGVKTQAFSMSRDDVDTRQCGVIVTREPTPRDHPALKLRPYPYHCAFSTERPIDLNRSVFVFEGDE